MASFQQVADKFGITPEQVKQLQNAMYVTWDGIAGDWFDGFESVDDAYDTYDSEAQMIAEATLDADRIQVYSGEDMTWVYKTEDGENRKNCFKLGMAAWNARPANRYPWR